MHQEDHDAIIVLQGQVRDLIDDVRVLKIKADARKEILRGFDQFRIAELERRKTIQWVFRTLGALITIGATVGALGVTLLDRL